MNAPDLANDLLESTGVVGDAGEVEGDGLPEDRYSDRELSWLAFNNRVLDLAKDSQRVPLLERAKFLAIFANNLDEFFMVRVAGLKRRIAAGVAVRTVSGLMPREVHQAILTRTRELVDEHSRVFEEEIRPALAAEGIEILRWHELSTDEKDRMRELFAERIFPVLTPLAVDPSHPFPYISGLSINLAVLVKNPVTRKTWCCTTCMPVNSWSRCRAITSSSATNRPSSSLTKRGRTLGTLTRANWRIPVTGFLTSTARLIDRPEM